MGEVPGRRLAPSGAGAARAFFTHLGGGERVAAPAARAAAVGDVHPRLSRRGAVPRRAPQHPLAHVLVFQTPVSITQRRGPEARAADGTAHSRWRTIWSRQRRSSHVPRLALFGGRRRVDPVSLSGLATVPKATRRRRRALCCDGLSSLLPHGLRPCGVRACAQAAQQPSPRRVAPLVRARPAALSRGIPGLEAAAQPWLLAHLSAPGPHRPGARVDLAPTRTTSSASRAGYVASTGQINTNEKKKKVRRKRLLSLKKKKKKKPGTIHPEPPTGRTADNNRGRAV